MQTLTPRQSQVLELIRQHIDNTGYPPTRADIAAELGFRSPNAAEEHLKALARLSRLLSDESFRQALLDAPDADALYTLLKQRDEQL